MAWRCAVAVSVCLLLSTSVPSCLVGAVGDYSRAVTYEHEVVVRCMDKRKATVQLLSENSDKWHVGEQSIDLRMSRRTFAAVQKYVPECYVLIQNVEAHVQMAEAQMFPMRRAQEEAWGQEVLGNVLRSKPSLADCEATIQNWEKARLQETKTWFEEYHDYGAMVTWYKTIAGDHPHLVRYVETIGRSFEGRNMPALHITASSNPHRHKIYFQCLIHAREWISGAVCMYIVNHLLKNYNTNDEVTHLLNNLEFIIVPFVNPDGYVHTWTTDRLWRKNRHGGGQSQCVGVDINRNFLQGWRGGKSPCAVDYGGPSPASEPETRNIVAYWKAHGPIIGAIDWHSYGKLLLHPWGWTDTNSLNDRVMSQIGQEMSNIIQKIHGQHYTSERSIDLYPCYGIATDWFYSDDANSNNGGYRAIPYVIELRDSGDKGFLLPPEQIIPTGEEIIPAVMHFAKAVLENPLSFVANAAVQDTMYPPRRG